MRCPLHQSGDDPAESEETLVDIASLPRSLVHGPRPTNVLTASEVDLQGGYRTQLIRIPKRQTRLSINVHP